MSQYRVEYAQAAQEDLERLWGVLLQSDASAAERAIEAIDTAMPLACRHPYICRPSAGGALGRYWRELLVDFGSSGYLVRFEITTDTTLTVMAVKHQRESDYH